jgi:putative transposase
VVTQANLLGVSRAAVYYQPAQVDPVNLDLMNRIDKLYTDYPFYDSRKMAKELGLQIHQPVNRKRTQRLMRDMGLEAVYPKPNLSLNREPHPVYPYLLKGLNISYPDQVWGADITYIKMSQGFLYLVAVIDWYSRYVLSWLLSNTLDAGFCIEAADQALSLSIPEIANFDQGVQFTSADHLAAWETKGVKVSMDGRGRCMDNIMTERLWRSLKYEEVYLKNYTTVSEARENISRYFDFYNHRRLHQSLNYQTPENVYFERR